MDLDHVNVVYAPIYMVSFASMAWISAGNVSESMHLISASKSSSDCSCSRWPTDRVGSNMDIHLDIAYLDNKILMIIYMLDKKWWYHDICSYFFLFDSQGVQFYFTLRCLSNNLDIYNFKKSLVFSKVHLSELQWT